MLDISTVTTVIASGGAAVSAVGAACLGVKVQIAAFRAVRAAGGSAGDGFAAGRVARAEHDFENQGGFEANPLWKGK